MESPPDVSMPANRPGRSSQHPADPAWLSQLLDTGADFDLRQRSNLHELDRQLHRHWNLGRNMVLAWCPHDSSALLLVVPHYAIAQYAAADRQRASAPDDDRRDFIMRLLTGPRRFSLRQIQNASKLLNTQLCEVALRSPLRGDPAEARVIDRLVRRYGISFVPNRAVALFDIVGFSLLEPFEQMTQLNSLAHSLNSAHSRMLGNRMPVNFARSTTGDGFYIWNRDLSIEANTSLYHFMHLALADNAIARRKARGRTVPLLRACFHVGGCYEFYQAEGLNPTIYSHIVGDATIDLARMIDRAMPGQILVGDFTAALPATEQADCDLIRLDTIHFVSRAQATLERLNGLELSGERIESIKCYLTGRARTDGTFTVRRIEISDKHGLTHNVFNAKINIYRRAAEPIFLGIEDRLLREDNVQARTVGHVVPADVAH
jgi:hypothetical protein